MQILYSRCCGLDVHKESVTACVVVYQNDPEPEVRQREFATHFAALEELKNWLLSQQVMHVVLESTGVYWKPVWDALQGSLPLTLANPHQVKNFPGEKTDARDSRWLAELLAHGLVRPSFIPPRPTRNLRDLTRYRVKLAEQRNRVHNRIHKVLEDASIKLDTVVSDILGATGRAIIQAIVAGKESPELLASLAKGTLQKKIPELRLALRGRVTEHHRFLLGELMDDLEFTERKIARLEQTLGGLIDPGMVARLCEIPGIDMITAWTILSELGSDMSVFPSAKHAASWAGLCPGNHESGGKRLSNRTRQGNRWLRRALCQSAWAATRAKNSYLAALFFRRAAKHGMRKAIIALAHHLLVVAYCMLRDRSPYRELGNDFFDRLRPERTRNRLVRRLQRLGLDVVLTPRADGSFAPPVLSGRPIAFPKPPVFYHRPDPPATAPVVPAHICGRCNDRRLTECRHLLKRPKRTTKIVSPPDSAR